MPKIIPTVGRVVHYWPTGYLLSVQPCAAIITYVHTDEMVNLVWFSPHGGVQGATSVKLAPAGDPAGYMFPHATWMPYQVGQAAKTEQLQEQLTERDNVLIEPPAGGVGASGVGS